MARMEMDCNDDKPENASFAFPSLVQTPLKFQEKRSENCTLNATDILYGYKPDSTKFYALNHVLIIAKYHIFQAWLDNSSPSFEIFYLVLKDKILCESRIAFKNNTLPKFRSKWTTSCALAPQNVSL